MRNDVGEDPAAALNKAVTISENKDLHDGRIWSLEEKRRVQVLPDGTHTVEEKLPEFLTIWRSA